MDEETNDSQLAIPRMATSLILTEAQEARLVSRALQRIDEVKGEMGFLDPQNLTGWMLERQRNQAQYDNDWSYRLALGGIFRYSNFSLNLSKRYCRLMAAKTTDDLVGSDPFFSCMPTETSDPELSKETEWYLQQEFSRVKAKANLKGALKTALTVNECTVKLAWVNTDTVYTGPCVVAVGPNGYIGQDGFPVMFGNGVPITTPKGKFIYKKDNFINEPKFDAKGAPVLAADGKTQAVTARLEKEPAVVFQHKLDFLPFDALQQVLEGRQNGLSLKEVDYRDFLCPLNVETTHEADINAHLFDMEFSLLKARYNGFAVSAPYMAMEYLSGLRAPKEVKGEEPPVKSNLIKMVNGAEVYIRCNPFEGDDNDPGYESEIFMVLDLGAKRAVWYDYLGNHMQSRPFEVIPGVEPVPGRWYGVGVFSMLQHKQDYIDTQFNRVNWKSMKASSLRFRIRAAVEQWKAGAQIVFGDDKVYDITDARYTKDNPPFFEINPHEIDEYAMDLIKLMIQAGSTEVGIVGPDDAAIAGLDSGKLATGLKSLERTGNLLMKFTEEAHSEALTAILEQASSIILEHMDEDTLIYRPETGSLLELNRDEIRGLEKNVVLHLTRSRSTETIETARMVIQLVREYYEAITPQEKFYLRDEYIRQLKALEVPDAGKKLKEVTQPEVDAWLKAQESAANLIPKASIATKYPDLLRSEQVQVLQREGITPGSAAEVAAADAQDAAQKGNIAGAEAEAQAKFAPMPAKK